MAVKQKPTETDKVLIRMLTENTGVHFLDSGGAYGRNWERNQKRAFMKEPSARVHVWKWGLETSVSTFHFLRNRLEYDQALDRFFWEWVGIVDPDERTSWFQNVDDFVNFLRFGPVKTMMPPSMFGQIVAYAMKSPELRVFLDGIGTVRDEQTINTCNHQSELDQVIQYTMFDLNGWRYCALFIHGGCDVRGGYTSPRFFKVCESELYDDDRVTVYCDGGHYWDFVDGRIETNDNRDLPTHKIIDLDHIDDLAEEHPDVAAKLQAEQELRKLIDTTKKIKVIPGFERPVWPEDLGRDFILAENGVGQCPICGLTLKAEAPSPY